MRSGTRQYNFLEVALITKIPIFPNAIPGRAKPFISPGHPGFSNWYDMIFHGVIFLISRIFLLPDVKEYRFFSSLRRRLLANNRSQRSTSIGYCRAFSRQIHGFQFFPLVGSRVPGISDDLPLMPFRPNSCYDF